ncbi:hypothetical protein IRJ41_022610, partial [Triplophysa rosa]
TFHSSFIQFPQISTSLAISKKLRFFDDSETEDEASLPLPAAPKVPVSPIRESTNRADNYSQLLFTEEAETMNSSSRAGNYSRPLARKEAENSTISRTSHSDFSEAVIRKIQANQEIVKEQMGTLIKLVYDLKTLSVAEDSPTLNSDNFPIIHHQQLLEIEGQLQQEDFRTAV